MSKKNTTIKPGVDLSRSEKIIIVVYELSGGKIKSLRFEDIAVAAFRKYPDDFHLRGYQEFPDSGDLVHKPLYDFRKNGLLEANNKFFNLTPRGLATAERLAKMLKGKKIVKEGRLSGFAEKEISRIEDLEAFHFFIKDEKDKILDTDFFTYLGATVRTPKNDFLGRLHNIENIIKELSESDNLSILRTKIPEFHKFMIKKFENIIRQKTT